MTALLFRGNESGEILSADGKVIGRVVPVEALEWLHGEGEEFECPPSHYFRGSPPRFWWRSIFRQKCNTVDIAAAAVRVPSTEGFGGNFAAGMEYVIDALGVKS